MEGEGEVGAVTIVRAVSRGRDGHLYGHVYSGSPMLQSYFHAAIDEQ